MATKRQNVLITGASSGQGEEMARQLAAKGHDLALCARRTEKLETVKSGILAADPARRVEIRALDVNDDEQVFEVFRAFKKDFGTIDRVIINAGLGKGAPIGTGRYDANRVRGGNPYGVSHAADTAKQGRGYPDELFRRRAKLWHPSWNKAAQSFWNDNRLSGRERKF